MTVADDGKEGRFLTKAVVVEETTMDTKMCYCYSSPPTYRFCTQQTDILELQHNETFEYRRKSNTPVTDGGKQRNGGGGARTAVPQQPYRLYTYHIGQMSLHIRVPTEINYTHDIRQEETGGLLRFFLVFEMSVRLHQ